MRCGKRKRAPTDLRRVGQEEEEDDNYDLQHEGGNNNGYRLDIAAEYSEQCALPDQLIKKGGDT